MLRYWTRQILERKFYCKECRAITSHELLAREDVSAYGPLPSGVPLVCRCKLCETFFVVFSQELFLGTLPGHAEYAKLLNCNRLFPGDWVYVEGKERPGKVAALYSVATEEIVELEFGDHHKERFRRPQMTSFSETAPNGFRLLPAQAGVALLGDPVYHVLRKAFGTAVGFVLDGFKEKLVVQLEGGKLLFITLPEENQRLPDSFLLKRLELKFFSEFSKLKDKVHVNVIHSVAYAYGFVESLQQKEMVARFLANQKDFRGVVDLVWVRLQGAPVPDDDLRLQTLRILEEEDSPLFLYEVEVVEGNLTVSAYYFEGDDLSKVKENLCGIAGLRSVHYNLEAVRQAPEPMREKAQKLSDSVKGNSRFADCRLHIVPIEEGVIVEGCTRGVLQKTLLNAFVIRSLKGIRTSVRLRVQNR